MRLETFADAEAAARAGAELIAAAARDAIGEGGRFSLAVSGGKTPWPMFELLGKDGLDWEHVDLFQVDERVAPDGDPDRNMTQIRASLPDAARERLRPMPVTDDDLDAAAARYEAELPRPLDLVHLGLGPDGHTASLVPDDPVLEVTDRLVALTGGEYQGRRRMTLTYPALADARRVFWLVAGENKRDAVGKLLAGDRSIPAGRVEAAGGAVLADRSAAPTA
ncbi:MAG TPA: 6-phosphogluconolactonase [Solirubrobacterales bacterium]|nr:6-phosphogluconolactonase [Solirubrobacterales bacterium]